MSGSARCCPAVSEKIGQGADAAPNQNAAASAAAQLLHGWGCDTEPVARALPIPGGVALVGTKSPLLRDDCESPIRRKRLSPFYIGETTVTNAQFAAFVAQTGYVTEAEYWGWSFVFWSQMPSNLALSQAAAGAEWWRRADGANWRNPNGAAPDGARCLPDHPVVHVSWADAVAYADWVGGRLPDEAEWEHAARGGRGDVRYPWGDAEPDDTGFFPCNIWQGSFPDHNAASDGYVTTAPAQSFDANDFGLYNMVGNVWEWTREPFALRSARVGLNARKQAIRGQKLIKGGSYLCHKSYCYRYRIAARTGMTPDSTTAHLGFRVLWDRAPGRSEKER